MEAPDRRAVLLAQRKVGIGLSDLELVSFSGHLETRAINLRMQALEEELAQLSLQDPAIGHDVYCMYV